MLIRGDLSTKVLVDFAVSIPALACRNGARDFRFRCVNDALFRRIILSILLVSGLLLVL